MNSNLLKSFLAAFAFAGAIGSVSPANASLISSYFGEDLNNGNLALIHPNADAAKASFFGSSLLVAAQDFESPSVLPTPTAGSISRQTSVVNANGRFPISGTNYLQFSTAAATSSFNVAMAPGVNGLGFFGIDIGDFGENLSLKFYFADTTTETFVVLHTRETLDANGGVFFLGLLADTQILSVDFINSSGNGNTIMAFDDISQVSRVPEPSTIALIAMAMLSLFGFGMMRRRAEA
jgi:hypothetical protein